jgi:hypothetical protein
MGRGRRQRRDRWLAACLTSIALALLFAAAPAGANEDAEEEVRIQRLPPECLPDTRLAGGDAVEVVVWCGVRPGKVRFEVEAAPGVRFAAVPSRARASGEGAGKDFRCHRSPKGAVCAGSSGGPLTVRELLRVPGGNACERIRVATHFVISGGAPLGCPASHPDRLKPDLGYYRRFRLESGLDADLLDNRKAIDRRIARAIANWRRGEPVARVTESQLGAPLLPLEERRFEFREELLGRTVDALERWVPDHAADTYAGYSIDVRHGAIVFRVGFTGDQEAQLEAFKREEKLFAPKSIGTFLFQPRYSERELGEFQNAILDPADPPTDPLWNSLGINTDANKVEVGTEHVAEMKRQLLRQFGTLDPFIVVFEHPAQLA